MKKIKVDCYELFGCNRTIKRSYAIINDDGSAELICRYEMHGGCKGVCCFLCIDDELKMNICESLASMKTVMKFQQYIHDHVNDII